MALNNPTANGGIGSAAPGNLSTNVTSLKHQTAVVYDLVSEGPIEGLIDGAASVLINGAPAVSYQYAESFATRKGTDIAYDSANNKLTDNLSTNVFDGLDTSDGVRQVLVVGGKKKGTAAVSTTAGSKIVTTNTSIMSFASDDVQTASTELVPQLRIEGAGVDGGNFAATITEFINTAAVKVALAPATTVSNADCKIDLVDRIASYSVNTATLATGGGVDQANTIIILSTPRIPESESPRFNFTNFGYAFRTGEREQPFLQSPKGVGSASFAHEIGEELPQSLISGNPSNATLTLDDANGDPLAEPTSGGRTYGASTLIGTGDPGIVDHIKVNVEMPRLESRKKNSSNNATGPSFVEYRILFKYFRNGSEVEEVVVHGPKTLSGRSLHANTLPKSATSVIHKHTVTPTLATLSFDTEKFQPFDDFQVTIQRPTATNFEYGNWVHENQSVIKSIECIVEDKLNYPYTAFGAVIIDAKDFREMPSRAYQVRGLKIKVPTNYFPAEEAFANTGIRRTTASYTRNVSTGVDASTYQDWDGKFRGDKNEFDATSPNYNAVYCNNPAWVFLDIMTNPRYGLGRWLDPDNNFDLIDKYSLFAIAKYCDELVPDGKGGSEPRFTANVYIKDLQEAVKVVKDFLTLFRGILVWKNGQITLAAMQEKSPVYTFTKGNVIDGMFTYSSSSQRFRSNQIRVTWNDPDNHYKQAVEIVEDYDEIARIGKIIPKETVAFGCTSQGQAHRYGKFHLFSEKLDTEIVSFKTGLNAGFLQPGDSIYIQDADYDDIQFSGRVSSSSTTTTINIDRAVTLSGTATSTLHLIYPSGGAYLGQDSATINGTTYRKGELVLTDEGGNTIDTAAKAANCKDDSDGLVQLLWSEDSRIESQVIDSYTSSSITVASAFSAAPNRDVIWSITTTSADGEKLAGSSKEFMIQAIKENDGRIFEITAVQHTSGKYDLIDRGWAIPAIPDVNRPPKYIEEVPVPRNLAVKAIPMGSGDNSSGDVNVSGSAAPDLGYKILLTWQAPLSTRLDKNGNSVTSEYEHLKEYQVAWDGKGRYDGNAKWERFSVDPEDTSYTWENVMPGTYRVRVRTVNIRENFSRWRSRRIGVDDAVGAHILSSQPGKDIPLGGFLDTTLTIAANGVVSFSNTSYNYLPPQVDAGTFITVSSGNTAQTQQDFSAMSANSVAYLLYDYSNTADPLQAIEYRTDTTSEDAQGNKLYPIFTKRTINDANTDFGQANGTFSVDAGETILEGSSTTFLSDYQTGDLIVLGDAGTTRQYAKVTYVYSNTSIQISDGALRAYSGANVFFQNYKIDRTKDAILAVVANTSGTYSLQQFTSKFKINTGEIGDGAVTETTIAENAVGGTAIQANSITSLMLTSSAVAAFTVSANSITSVELASNSIQAIHIQANSIGASEVAANSIGSVAIIADSIDSSHIAANSIDSTMIIANAIGTSEIAANSIDSAQIISGSIDTVHVSANAITNAKIASNSITTASIAAGSVTEAKIAANSIGTAAIQANSITSAQLTADAINSFTVGANEITAVEIASGTITNALMAANSITSVEIAANSIGSAELTIGSVSGTIIASGGVGTTQLATGSVTGIIIANGAVDTNQLAGSAITAAKIAANAVTSGKVATNAINTAQIIANAITSTLLASNSVTNETIAANSIDSVSIATGAVGAIQIATGAVTNAKMAANAIGAAQIIAGSITSSELAANSVGSAQIAANTITNNELTANSVTAAIIAANSITNNELSINSVNAAIIQAGTIDSSHITANSITAAAIVTNAIDNSHISANSITSVSIQSDAVGTNQISSNAITNAKISSGAVDTNEIAANAITNAKIESGAVTNASINASGIEFAKITSVSITSAMIQANSITSAKIAADQVGTSEIAANSITSALIAANQIGTAEIVSGSITTALIAGNAITSALIAANQVGTAEISSGSIGTLQIAANAITAAKIAANQIGTSEIIAGSIDSLQIAANAITNAKISSTDSLTLTVAGGSAGGWTLNSTSLSSANIVFSSVNQQIIISDGT